MLLAADAITSWPEAFVSAVGIVVFGICFVGFWWCLTRGD